jgi:hypothetical protein
MIKSQIPLPRDTGTVSGVNKILFTVTGFVWEENEAIRRQYRTYFEYRYRYSLTGTRYQCCGCGSDPVLFTPWFRDEFFTDPGCQIPVPV